MALNKAKNNKAKICPFLDRGCLKADCMIYHEEFDRCMIDLLAFNLFSLAAGIKRLIDKLK